MPEPFPIFLLLEGRSVLVVGGGSVARRKIAALLRAGARVTVLAPELEGTVRAWAAAGRVSWCAERFSAEAADSLGEKNWALVFAASSECAANRAVYEWAAARGTWCNAADAPDACDFYLPAVHRDGPVLVAVGTSGRVPALAAFLRDRISEWLPDGLAAAAEELGRLRQVLRRRFPGPAGRSLRRERLRAAIAAFWRARRRDSAAGADQ